MENMEKFNSIDISLFDENEVISLLLGVIKLLNTKASQLRDQLNNDLALANKQIATHESTIKELSEKIESLNSELSKANISVQEKESELSKKTANLDSQNKTIQELTDSLSIRESTIKKLSEKVESLNSELSKANNSVQEKESELSKKTANLDSQNKTIQELKDSLNNANNIIDEYKIRVVKIYANMISDLLASRKPENSYWDKYLADICHKIGKFIEEATNIEFLTFSIKSSNSWLTRIASITWWSKLPTISNVVNNNVPNINELNKAFDNLVQVLIDIDIMIQLPNCIFCDVIDNYEANLKEKSNFKELFENSEITDGTLCEIYKLAINGNKGLCLTFNS